MKTKGRPVSSNIEDRRKKKSAFSSAGRANYAGAWDGVLKQMNSKKAKKGRVNGR
jgi:hypothetical protein